MGLTGSILELEEVGLESVFIIIGNNNTQLASQPFLKLHVKENAEIEEMPLIK